MVLQSYRLQRPTAIPKSRDFGSIHVVAAPGEQMYEFAYPQHRRGAAYYEQPVGHSQRRHIEERSAELHYGYLPHEDYKGYEQESLAPMEMECRASARK